MKRIIWVLVVMMALVVLYLMISTPTPSSGVG